MSMLMSSTAAIASAMAPSVKLTMESHISSASSDTRGAMTSAPKSWPLTTTGTSTLGDGAPSRANHAGASPVKGSSGGTCGAGSSIR